MEHLKEQLDRLEETIAWRDNDLRFRNWDQTDNETAFYVIFEVLQEMIKIMRKLTE